MVKLIERYTYGFEDVSLEPYPCSKINSRREIDTSYKLSNGIVLQTPIIASPMADVCDDKLAIAIAKSGAIGCIHRFQYITDQVKMVKNVLSQKLPVFAAVGTDETFKERTAELVKAGVLGIVVDVAFLNDKTLKACRWIRENFGKNLYLISGNVATGAGFRMGVDAGLNAIRVGIGNGQACRTSRVTGVGIGLITSIMECYEEHLHYGNKVAIICDGGMDVGGSFCKAIAAGANMAMMGRALAATWESPGKLYAKSTDFSGGQLGDYEGMAAIVPITTEHAQYGVDRQIERLLHNGSPIFKQYRGSASMEAQLTYKDRGDIITSEGVASLVQIYGSVADVIGRFNGALRSSMSYLGATNLDIYRENAIFRLVGEGVFSQQKARGLQRREITI